MAVDRLGLYRWDSEMSDVFSLGLPGDADVQLRVVSFRGKERLSQPFSFSIRFVLDVRQPNLAERLVGQRATLTLDASGRRSIHGIVRKLKLDPHGTRSGIAQSGKLTIVPRLWTLSQTRDSRIFQDQSIIDIVGQVLDDHAIVHRNRLVRSYAPRRYCLQYQESDLDFVQRLLAEEGVFYAFRNDDAEGEVIELMDAAWSYATLEPAAVPFVAGDASHDDAEGIRDFSLRRAVHTSHVALREYDFTRPLVSLSGQAPVDDVDGGSLEVYRHRSAFKETCYDNDTATIEREQRRVNAATGAGRSRCRRLIPGSVFQLAGHPDSELGAKYAITQVEHRGSVPELCEDPSAEVYANRFRCVAAELPARPKPPKTRHRQVVETATVVGPEGEEIHTDEHGRIKVQFHWDRLGSNNERSSCWIRVMQPWAGDGWGAQFIPRIGMEVIVSFVEGDVDLPIVLGSTYNAKNVTPFMLPENKTKSGLRTRSTLDGDAGNELSFEDQKGDEVVHLRAQRDLDELVLNDHRTVVEHDQTLKVGRRQVEHVVERQLKVIGDNRILSVGGSATESVTQQRSARIGGDETLRVDGQRLVEVAESETHAVQGDQRFKVGGRFRASIDGEATTIVQQDDRRVVKGDRALLVDGDHVLQVDRNARTSATRIELYADEEIVLQCGSSRVSIGPDRVTIRSDELWLQAASELQLRGHTGALLLDGDAALTGHMTRVSSVGASLELTAAAALKGASVSLGGAGGAKEAAIVLEEKFGETPPPLEIALPCKREDAYLSIRDEEENEIETRPAAAADARRNGFAIFQIDPESYDGAIELVWVEGDRERHLAGPCNVKVLRNMLAVGRPDDAQLLAKSKRKPPPKKRVRTRPRRKTERDRRAEPNTIAIDEDSAPDADSYRAEGSGA